MSPQPLRPEQRHFVVYGDGDTGCNLEAYTVALERYDNKLAFVDDESIPEVQAGPRTHVHIVINGFAVFTPAQARLIAYELLTTAARLEETR
jgi:hypothetical protein